jgi:hypothetical protein
MNNKHKDRDNAKKRAENKAEAKAASCHRKRLKRKGQIVAKRRARLYTRIDGIVGAFGALSESASRMGGSYDDYIQSAGHLGDESCMQKKPRGDES